MRASARFPLPLGEGMTTAGTQEVGQRREQLPRVREDQYLDNPLNLLCFPAPGLILAVFVAVLVHATYPWSA